jgi:hypothetical protein
MNPVTESVTWIVVLTVVIGAAYAMPDQRTVLVGLAGGIVGQLIGWLRQSPLPPQGKL